MRPGYNGGFEAALFARGATDAQCAYAATLWRWATL